MPYNPLDFKLLVAQGLARTLDRAVYVLERAGELVCSPEGDPWLIEAVPVKAYRARVEPDGKTEIFK